MKRVSGRRRTASANTQPTTESHLSLFSPPPFPYLYPPLVVAGNRALSGAHLPRQIYTRDARFECLEKRFAFESTIDLRRFDSPRGNNLGRHIGSDATTIFDSFVPAMNFQVVASSMLPRSIARASGLVIACRCDMSRRFFLREFHPDSTPLRIGSKYTGMRFASAAIIYSAASWFTSILLEKYGNVPRDRLIAI